jgi:hypothetical protein
MVNTEIDQIRFCAFCPNYCRILYPSEIPQWESLTPSALAFLCYAVIKGFLSYTEEIEDSLTNLEACNLCQKGCPYNLNISGSVLKLVEKYHTL